MATKTFEATMTFSLREIGMLADALTQYVENHGDEQCPEDVELLLEMVNREHVRLMLGQADDQCR